MGRRWDSLCFRPFFHQRAQAAWCAPSQAQCSIHEPVYQEEVQSDLPKGHQWPAPRGESRRNPGEQIEDYQIKSQGQEQERQARRVFDEIEKLDRRDWDHQSEAQHQAQGHPQQASDAPQATGKGEVEEGNDLVGSNRLGRHRYPSYQIHN